MTRARKATALAPAVQPVAVGASPVGTTAVAFQRDALQDDRNQRTRDDIHRAEIFYALGAADVDPGTGLFATALDEATSTLETIWIDGDGGAVDSPDLATAFAELRLADIDGVEPSE